MAQRTVATFVSDLSGKPIDGDGATVRFGLDAISYEIDLTAKEQMALRNALAPYIESARKDGGPSRRTRRSQPSSSSEAPTPAEIREWGVANGHDVPARGRIPALVREAFDAAH